MKKVIALAAATLLGIGASYAEGWSVGGSVAAWRNESAKTTTVAIMPEANYALSDKWTVGAQVGYEYKKHDHVSHNNSFKIDPYVRYTIWKTGIVRIICDGAVDVALGATGGHGHNSDTSVGFGIGLKPGVALDLNKHFTLVAHTGFLGYQGCNKAGRGYYDRGFGFHFDDAVNFGFYYNF